MFVSLGFLLLYRLIRGPGRFEDLPAGVREHDTFRKIVVVGAFLLGLGGMILGMGFLLETRPLSLLGGWITGVALAAGAVLRAVFWYLWGDLGGKRRLEGTTKPS